MHLFARSKKFQEPLTTAVYTTTHVMKGNSTIVWVSHELDGDWQFLGSEPVEDYAQIAMVVSLGEIINKDKTVLEVSELPYGYAATRKDKSGKWEVWKIDYTEQQMKEFGYYCSKCGIYHRELPMAYGKYAPDAYSNINEAERETRCVLGDSQCIIDDSQYFIRGVIEIAVGNSTQKFLWNLWVSVSEEVYERMSDLWEDENRILENPYRGHLATQLEPYPPMLNLPVLIKTRKVGLVPIIELEECNHPLFFEQENGINHERIVDFAKRILYDH